MIDLLTDVMNNPDAESRKANLEKWNKENPNLVDLVGYIPVMRLRELALKGTSGKEGIEPKKQITVDAELLLPLLMKMRSFTQAVSAVKVTRSGFRTSRSTVDPNCATIIELEGFSPSDYDYMRELVLSLGIQILKQNKHTVEELEGGVIPPLLEEGDDDK